MEVIEPFVRMYNRDVIYLIGLLRVLRFILENKLEKAIISLVGWVEERNPAYFKHRVY